jgi:prevent-host-death family protein
MRVSVAEARNKFTKLIQAVERGERVTVCRHGKPVVDLVRSTDDRTPRKFGTFKGEKLVLDPDWARPQNDVEAWLRGDV